MAFTFPYVEYGDMIGEYLVEDYWGDMVDIRINAKDGFDVGMENNNFVILNDTLTDDLINEGIAREIISKVQTMRKNNNYEIT